MHDVPLLVPGMPTADQLRPYLNLIDARRQYTNFGPLSREFEERLINAVAPKLTPRHIVSVCSGTMGLELSLAALQLPPSARVLVPSLTFVASATAVSRAGLKPVFADVDPATWCLSPVLAETLCLQHGIDAVLPVATFGCPQNPGEWDAFTRRTGIPVVIDAAGAFGNQTAGVLTDVVFSFHATKSLGAGEGGAVISPSEDRAARIRRLSNFGIDTLTGELLARGTNAKMSEYHCAVGLASLDNWPTIATRRIALHRRYLDCLTSQCAVVMLQERPSNGVYSVLVLAVPRGISVRNVRRQLERQGIMTRAWYCLPLHHHAALRSEPQAGSLSVVDDLANRLLGVPFFPQMRDDDVDFVCECVSTVISDLS